MKFVISYFAGFFTSLFLITSLVADEPIVNIGIAVLTTIGAYVLCKRRKD